MEWRSGGAGALRRARPPRPWLAVGALSALAAVVLAACGRAVTVAQPDTQPAVTARCAALAAALPDRMADQPRLAVTPDNGTTAAWGSPAITWRCGVGTPAAYRPTAQLVTVAGVDWLPEQLTGGVRFTSIGTDPATELTVPARYPQPAGLLTQLPSGS